VTGPAASARTISPEVPSGARLEAVNSGKLVCRWHVNSYQAGGKLEKRHFSDGH
jgi:hypothetical protein